MSGIWQGGAFVFLVALVPSAWVALRGGIDERLVAVEFAGMTASLILLCLAEAQGGGAFMDVAVAAALLAFGGGLVFARFLERWL